MGVGDFVIDIICFKTNICLVKLNVCNDVRNKHLFNVTCTAIFSIVHYNYEINDTIKFCGTPI